MDTTYRAMTLIVLLGALVVFGRAAATDAISAEVEAPAAAYVNHL